MLNKRLFILPYVLKDVANMEADWKDLRSILWAVGLANDTATGAGVMLNVAESAAAVVP